MCRAAVKSVLPLSVQMEFFNKGNSRYANNIGEEFKGLPNPRILKNHLLCREIVVFRTDLRKLPNRSVHGLGTTPSSRPRLVLRQMAIKEIRHIPIKATPYPEVGLDRRALSTPAGFSERDLNDLRAIIHCLLLALQSTLLIFAVIPLCLGDIAGIRAHVCLRL